MEKVLRHPSFECITLVVALLWNNLGGWQIVRHADSACYQMISNMWRLRRTHEMTQVFPWSLQYFVVNFQIILTCICLTAGVNLLTPSGHRQIRDVITMGIDVWAQNAERRGGGWTIHPSRHWLISCARAAVLYVCLSIALTSCTTSMAKTNLDAIRKQKNAEYSKRYRLKRKMKMQQQAPTTSEAETEKLQV